MNTDNAPTVQDTACDFENLYNAMLVCKGNVMWKDSVAGWVKNGIVNCAKLEEQLKNGTYDIDEYSRFTIYEPKKRDIVSTRFKDRVFQRSLCDTYLTEEISKSFIYDNGACLCGKGTEFARSRLISHLQRFFRKHGRNGYVLKCDITNFFGSTPHDVVKSKIRKLCKDDWAYSEVCRIIDSFGTKESPHVGMGLGSQATQLCQLAVLNDIDHGIKERYRIKHYVRYMDDLVLIHEDKEVLKIVLMYIRGEFESMGLKLSEKKTQIFPLTQPVHFLGFSLYLTETGKVVKKVLPEKISHERRKLKRMKNLVDNGIMTREKLDKCFEAWLAHATAEPSDRRKGQPFLGRSDDYFRIENMKRFYKSLWEG